MPIKYLTPTLDTWVDQDNPAAVHPTDTTLRIFQDNANAKSTVALLTWDVVGEIPAGATIVDAYFRFWWEDFDGDEDAWFQISQVTGAWNAATDWTTIPARAASPITTFRRNSLGLDDDVPTVIGYDYIRDRALRAPGSTVTPDNPRALFLLVKGWYDTSIANHGVSIGWSYDAPAGDTFYKMYSADEPVAYRRPLLAIEYADGDSLPAVYTDEQGGFYGSALDLLERELVPIPDVHLYLDYADGTTVDLFEDWIGASGLERNIPFLLETLELPSGSFLLSNPGGRYSDTNRESDFYGDALSGAYIRAVVEIEGQQKVLYRGEVMQVRDSTNNTAELLCVSRFNRYLNYELTTPRSITAYGDHWTSAPAGKITGYYAALIYDAFHNYAGLPEADMNINRFADALASHTAAKEEGEQIWVKNKLHKQVRGLCDAGHCQPYQDQNGDLALHYWEPNDPETTDEVSSDSFEWYEERSKIVNQLEVNWNWEYPEELGRDPEGGDTVYTDAESVTDHNGVIYEQAVSTTAFRVPAQPTLLGEFYTQVLSYPHKRGTLNGGSEFLRYDLGSVFWLRNDSKGIYQKVRVIGYDPKPGFDAPWSITMEVIPTNWTLPKRTFVSPGTPIISFTNDLAAPVPSAIAFRNEPNGEVTIQLAWTYDADLVPADGYIVYWNNGPTAGQPVPTREDNTGSEQRPNTLGSLPIFYLRIPGNHYATIGVSAFAYTRRGYFESAIVSSAAAPDWEDANDIGNIVSDLVPTNDPGGLTSATNVETEVGTATAQLTWTYVQGAKIADLFFIIGNFGDGAPAAPVYGAEDWSMVLPAGARDWTIELPKKNKFATFEIAAVKHTSAGYAIGAWIGHANWTDIRPAAVAHDLDDIGDGATHGKVELTSLNANRVDLDSADGDLDDVPDGATHGKVKGTQLTGGELLIGPAMTTTVQEMATEMILFGELTLSPDGAADAADPREYSVVTLSDQNSTVDMYPLKFGSFYHINASQGTLRFRCMAKHATTWGQPAKAYSYIAIDVRAVNGATQAIGTSGVFTDAAYTAKNIDVDISGLPTNVQYEIWLLLRASQSDEPDNGETTSYLRAPLCTLVSA